MDRDSVELSILGVQGPGVSRSQREVATHSSAWQPIFPFWNCVALDRARVRTPHHFTLQYGFLGEASQRHHDNHTGDIGTDFWGEQIHIYFPAAYNGWHGLSTVIVQHTVTQPNPHPHESRRNQRGIIFHMRSRSFVDQTSSARAHARHSDTSALLSAPSSSATYNGSACPRSRSQT